MASRRSSNPSRHVASTSIATLVAAVVLLPLLGHKPLTDWDEAIYAEVAREMLSLGWLVPHWNQQVWLEKPPLVMWLTAVLFRVFGVSEFTARAVSALSGVAVVGLLHGWLLRSRDGLTAWLSTVILLATSGFLHACHVGETDVLLSLGCCVALIGLSKVDGGDPGGWVPFWIGFAIALMTKGAAAGVLPLTAMVLAGLGHWRLDRLRPAFWIGLALFLLLVLPWHFAMFYWFGKRFVDEYLGLHVIARATQQIEGHATPWWYYFKVLLVSAAPFVLLYPIAIARVFRAQTHDLLRVVPRAHMRAWAVFAVVVVGSFTLVQTRLPQYIVPAYPALAVLTAVYLGERLRPLGSRRPAFWIKLGLVTAGICVVSVWATNSGRKSLHSANHSNGGIWADNKDATALLRAAFRQDLPIGGPLLVWREGENLSMATDVFYARREVRQVEGALLGGFEGRVRPTDRYTYNPRAMGEEVVAEPRLILLDRALVARIPAELVYRPLRVQGSVELGLIARAPGKEIPRMGINHISAKKLSALENHASPQMQP